jgi:hypothetical protein
MGMKRQYYIGLFLVIVLAAFGCNPPAINSFSPTSPVSMRANTTQIFTVNVTGNNLKYTWVLDNIPQVLTKSFSYTPTTADIGSHTLKVTVSNADGSVSNVWKIGVQLFQPVWEKSYGGSGDDVATAVQQTADSGYILAGYSNSTNISGTVNHGDYDFYVLKLTATCAVEWQGLYGGSGLDKAHGIAQTSDGGYIVVGSSQSGDITGAANHGGSDFYVLKLTSTGAVQWQGLYGGSGDDFGLALQVSQNGAYAFSGYSSSSLLASDGRLIKLNSFGTVILDKTYDTGAMEFIYSLKETVNVFGIANGFILTGSKNGISGWVVRTNTAGTISWQQTYGGSSILGCILLGVQQADDGDFIVTGWVQKYDDKGNNKPDACTIKYSATGSKVWETLSGGISMDSASALENNQDWSRYILTGRTQSDELPGSSGLPQVGDNDVYISMLDTSGECLYQERFGNNALDDGGNAIVNTSGDPDSFLIAGQKGSGNAHDIYLLRYEINK